MALIKYSEWRMKESTAFTRQRDAAGRGTAPMRADFMSHSTPSPFIMKRAEKELGRPHPKKHHKRKKVK